MNLEEYEREGRARYSAFSKMVAGLIEAAIEHEAIEGVAVVTSRAKAVPSLSKKLEDRNLLDSKSIENELKDLAGCRIVFYTNTALHKFLSSRIIQENFEVLEVRIHEPGKEVKDANELYQANHYLVMLREERLKLPEYARFAGMRCEVQMQTIFTHSWAQLAHDTIYKSPALKGFGERQLEAIGQRLSSIMEKYLVPAGYEFDKVLADFARLMEGKEQFDGNALEAIAKSQNNNERVETIEKLASAVLPLYDDIYAEFPSIVEVLTDAMLAAREAAPVAREGYYSLLEPETSLDVARAIAPILTRYRYVDIGRTFDALTTLFASSISDEERKLWLEAADHLAEHNMHVWNEAGPFVQTDLVGRVGKLDPAYRQAIAPIIVAMLGQVLEAEVTGTTNASNTVTFHSGAVIVSAELLQTRHNATALLEEMFETATTDDERRSIIAAMDQATRAPYNGNYSNELAAENARSASKLLDFLRAHRESMGHFLQEHVEDRALRFYRTYIDLPKRFADDVSVAEASKAVVESALDLRDALNADPEFVRFKTLVGFEVVFPPSWEDEEFQFERVEKYRRAQIEQYVGEVTDANAKEWFERISRLAATKSADGATFPMFGVFLSMLAERKPKIAAEFAVKMGPDLAGFAHRLIEGLVKSGDEVAKELLADWIDEGQHLSAIALYLRYTDQFDMVLLMKVTQKAIELDNRAALRHVVAASEQQVRAEHPEAKAAFVATLHHFIAKSDDSWLGNFIPWLHSPLIESLDENEASQVLGSLVGYDNIENSPEYVVAAIAKAFPSLVLAFFGKRQEYYEEIEERRERRRYHPFPLSVFRLHDTLGPHPQLLLEAARGWYAARPGSFRYTGGHFVSAVMKGKEAALVEALKVFAQSGNEDDALFALSIINSLNGDATGLALIPDIVAGFDLGSDVHDAAEGALRSAGVLHGEFGTAEMLEGRKAIASPWLQDGRQNVRAFAKWFIKRADSSIAGERRTARERIAQRRLDYGEDPTGEGNAED